MLTARDIRQGFLDYFARHDHRIVPSSPLVPADDPTLLFTNAGMNQFKDLFLGREERAYRRATTVQKCMRVSGKHNDLDNVGPSLRHHTFFEMLGNFSFGDYFKREAIPFAWELLTEVWALDRARLFPSVFKGEGGIPRDDESYAVWATLVPVSQIHELGLADNFWSMGDTGPCGRCSEIYYFRGPAIPCEEPACRGLECNCDRYVEIWNNVFMEFDRQADGTLAPLPALSVDTGMGLERVTSVIQGRLATYDTDLFTPILGAIGDAAGRRYTAAAGPVDHPDVSMRVIADHLRAMTFLIADGVMPSNEWRGYVLRKIMRRAMRHGKKLGYADPVLYRLAETVIAEMGHAYPELGRHRDAIVRTIRAEEERFDAVLTSGLPKLEDLIDRVAASGSTIVPGEDVFRLYDSLGVPIDFMEDLAEQRGLSIDRQAYDAAMTAQRDRARAAGAFKAGAGSADVAADAAAALAEAQETFVGYDTTEADARVTVLLDDDGRLVDRLMTGAAGFAALDRTPFYLEAGGQVSDTGTFAWADGGRATVEGVVGSPGRARLHRVRIDAGPLSAGTTVTARADHARRDATRRNHTATHLLHAALRARLGSHVRQAGSLVAPDRLRFDFTHTSALDENDRREIERVVSEQIVRNTPVQTEVQDTESAIQAGAMALFGEKYGDRVRVVSIPGFSVELCGGTHVRATGDIGPFVLTEESGVAAGVRRIEALTGAGAVEYLQVRQALLGRTVGALGVPPDQAPSAVEKLQAEVKRLSRENAQLKLKAALGGGTRAGTDDDVLVVGDAKVIVRRVAGLDKDALRSLTDSLRDRLQRGVVVIAAETDDKVQIVVSVTKDLTGRVKAGDLVKQLAPTVGGRGGGRPDFAEAGGKDAAGIDALLSQAKALISGLLQ
ncbi:MAG TPA: alanine--tRNA ligase [Vicinamibacterales bacterium]|nr:alanine--tRNA ligase [Vicinamibacterales bacterium]